MTTSNSGIVIAFEPAHHAQLIPYIAALHASCITHDHTPATFIPPLSHEKLLYWWKDRIAEVSGGTRLIFLLIRGDPSSMAVTLSPIKGTDVLGVVMLDMPPFETDVFRASIEQLLVHTNHRRQGGARTLVQILETEAILRAKTLLVCSLQHPIFPIERIVIFGPSSYTIPTQTLNVESGCPAEVFFRALGYTEVGKIPSYYNVNPSGQSKDATFFYKQLPS